MDDSVAALLRAENLTDPQTAIRRRARSLVAAALADGWKGPPFDLNALATRQKLIVSESTTLSKSQDACVVPGHIILNANKAQVRRRYSIAHEIIHTLFPDYASHVESAGQLWRDDKYDELEKLCQIGAAELIFPEQSFLISLGRCGLSLAGILKIKKQFDASPEATFRRAVELASEPALGLVFRPVRWENDSGVWIDTSQGDAHQPRLRLAVTAEFASPSWGEFSAPLGSIAPDASAPDRAWKRVALAKGGIVIHSSTGKWPSISTESFWESEAMTSPLGWRRPDHVLGLLRPV